MRITQLVFSASFALISNLAWSAEYSSEADYLQEFPVVLSASRLSQPLSEAPNAMTVIDRNMIVASGFRTLPDLFKLVPGMYVSYYKGSQAIVSYHGATDQYSRRMQVLIDGRSVYLPPLSTVSWADLPITVDDIERIEVIRGPAAASYGANSTQGVISIITKDADSVTGKSVSYTHGNKGVNDVAARFGGHGEKFDYRATIAYSADNGYDDLTTPPNNIPATQPRALSLLNNNHDSNQARLLNYRANYHPDAVDSYDMQLGVNHDVQGVGFIDKNPSPTNPFGTNGNTPHDLISNSGHLQLDWVRALDDAAELRLRYYHIQNNEHEAFPVYLGGTYYPGPVTQSVKSGRDEIELQHTLTLTDSNRLVYGTAWRQDQMDAQGYALALTVLGLSPSYAASSKSNEYRLFANDEWRFTPKLLLNSGAMFEQDRMGHSNWSPRASLNYHVTSRHTLRVGASVAYRTPAMAETNFPALQPGDLWVINNTVNSPGLLPERMFSREIGYLGEFRDWGTSLDMRLFNDQVGNGIYRSTPGNIFVNGATSVYRGIETTLKQSISENSDLILNLSHMLASSNGPALAAAGQVAFNSINPMYNDILTGSIPKNSASVLYAQRLGDGWSFSTSYFYQDSMQPYDRPIIDFQPVQHRVDLRLAKAFHRMAGVEGDVAVVIQNLFNTDYTEYVANNLFNQRAFATLTVKW